MILEWIVVCDWVMYGFLLENLVLLLCLLCSCVIVYYMEVVVYVVLVGIYLGYLLIYYVEVWIECGWMCVLLLEWLSYLVEYSMIVYVGCFFSEVVCVFIDDLL